MKKYIISILVLAGLLFLGFVFGKWLVANDSSIPKIDNDKSFSVIVIPDTQMYSEKYPEIFCNQTNWIVDNINRLNIVYAVQLGDIVNDGGSQKQWDVAERCMKKLDGKIPYGLVPGNHDTDKIFAKSSGFSNYNARFPLAHYSSESWYAGNYKDNQNNAQRIDALGMKLLFINLEIEPSDRALVWAEEMTRKFPDTYTIVSTHKYLPDDSLTRDKKLDFSEPVRGNTGEQMWQKLISKNCSIKMVLNGHYHATDGENRITSKNNCGDSIPQILQDYQTREKGGNGRLRIYTFTPGKQIEVSTFSTETNTFEEDESSRFVLSL